MTFGPRPTTCPLFARRNSAYGQVMLSLASLFRARPDPREAHRPLWHAVVQTARTPHWYAVGGVADTLDGRFELVSLIFSLLLHRIDAEPGHDREGALLTELFVEDMDGQIRQIGFGDMVVGKQIGKMVSALGGRLSAYAAPDGTPELRAALVRNLWRGTEPGDAAAAHVLAHIAALRQALAAMPIAALLTADQLPGNGQ